MDRCALLDVLPAEIRLRIYEELFDEAYHSSLLIRSDSKIELISLAKAHAALLRTCWTIYREAVPVLYDATTFRVQIYPVDGYSSHGNINRLYTSTPFLRRIRHVEIKSCIVLPCHIEPALRLMKTFACALEDSDARIKTLNVRSKLFNDMSKRKLYEYREKLGRRDEVGEAVAKCQLFQKMIDGASNSTGLVSISLDGLRKGRAAVEGVDLSCCSGNSTELARDEFAPSFNVTNVTASTNRRSVGQSPPFSTYQNIPSAPHTMPPSEEPDPNNTQAVTREELSKRLQESQQRLQREIREAQAKVRARTFRRDVEAAASSTRGVIRPPPAQQPQTLTVPERAASYSMAVNMSLDSLIVQIIAKAHANPPTGPARELQDLVSQLPAAVHAERAAYEARITNIMRNANGNDVSRGYVDLDAQREIQSLTSQNESLKADVERLEDAKKMDESEPDKKKIKRLNKNLAALRATDAQKEINKLKSLNGNLRADVQRLQQAAKDSQRRANPTTTSSHAMTLRASTTSFANGNNEQPTGTNANLTPIVNLQPRFQPANRSLAQDRRPQLYTASPSGFFYQPPLAKDAANPFLGNDKQVIHPARLGQLDTASVSSAHKQTVTNIIAPTFSKQGPASMQVAKPESTGQDGGHPGADNPTAQSPFPSTTRCALPSDNWQATFGDLFKRMPSQGLQTVSPNGSQGLNGNQALNGSQGPNEGQGTPASATQDPRLVGRVTPANSKKRVASPEIGQEAPKKIKIETSEDQQVHAEPSTKPESEEAPREESTASPALASRVGMAQIQAPSAETDCCNTTPQAAAGDMGTAASISNSISEPAGPVETLQSPKQQDRKDSAVAFPVAPLEPTMLSGRRATCLTCHFGKRLCDEKSPCTHCAANGFDCVYWDCAYGEACKSASCWYLHKPAKSNGQLSLMTVARSDPSV